MFLNSTLIRFAITISTFGPYTRHKEDRVLKTSYRGKATTNNQLNFLLYFEQNIMALSC